MKILVIEDEKNIASVIQRGLSEEGFAVDTAYDGETGLALAQENTYDAIVLDVILPKINGWDLCRLLRDKSKSATPILMLSALSSTDNVVKGLETGADDYLTKPFHLKELAARLRVLSRRSGSYLKASAKLSFSEIEINLDTKEAFCKGQKINLTRRELHLLEFFLRNPCKVLSRFDILDKVWGMNFHPGTNVVDVFVCYLRSKLEKVMGRRVLHTIQGLGYILKDEHEVEK